MKLSLRVFEENLLMKIFGLVRERMIRYWRRLHNEELHNLDSSLNIIIVIRSRKKRWGDHVAGMEDERNALRILFEKPGQKRLLGISTYR
jgi:hypothetical protein